MSHTLRLTLARFSEAELERQFAQWSGFAVGDAPAQVRYLGTYLQAQQPRAQTIVIERPYVDRHYLEEYAGYYATTLHAPSPHTVRLHFFSSRMDASGWRRLLANAETAQSTLEAAYLGYSVVRPLAQCPVGRTVLRTYDDGAHRCYEVARTRHAVHLAGLTLHVEALPFQQQDQGVGACATTALWAALARVMRADGGRAVTPLAVTNAANRVGVTGRVLPAASGLNLEQMLGAVRELGYAPHLLKVGNELDHFLLVTKTYVSSGIPVVLRAYVGGTLHALTVAGFRYADDGEPLLQIPTKRGTLASAGVRRLYVHDDRLGPYARFERSAAPPGADGLWFQFEPRRAGFDEFKEPMRITDSIVPLYPKLRMTAEDLLAHAAEWEPLVSHYAGEGRAGLRVEPSFRLSGTYLADLRSKLGTKRGVRAVTRAFLSRYVGVLRFFVGNKWHLDVVLDTTDMKRDGRTTTHALLVAASDASVTASLGKNAEQGLTAELFV